MGDGAEVERHAADVHGGVALRLADDVGDGDLLRAEAFGDADLPLVADARAGGGGLREDAAGGDGGGVELVLDVEVEAAVQRGVEASADGQAGEVGDGDLAAVEGEAQRDAPRRAGRRRAWRGAPRTIWKKRFIASPAYRDAVARASGGCRWRVRGG